MGLSVSASRGAGDRAGTITRMCLALMFSLATVTGMTEYLRATSSKRFGIPTHVPYIP